MVSAPVKNMDKFSNKVSKEILIHVVFDPEEWLLKLTIDNTESPSQTFRAKMGQRISITHSVDVLLDDIKCIKNFGRIIEVKL